MQGLTVYAPAKVNLFLGIGAQRADGYHDVTSVFQTIELCDVVRLTPADELTVTCSADLGVEPERNLAFQAARAFSDAFEVDVLLDIHIDKHIPAGAGLAGGSSDAAAVLAALAHWASLPLDDPRLLAIARSLGADVAFFLYGGTALMSGRGDELAERLPAPVFDVVLVKPDAPVSTAAAYRAFDTDSQVMGDPEPLLEALRAHAPVSAVAELLGNNLAPAAVSIVPEVGEVGRWLAEQPGARGALVSGSGSTVFALCDDSETARRIADAAQLAGWWSVATSTSPAGVRVG